MMPMQKEDPIGLFDSGVGGISVLKELVSLMPQENYYYFGDSKNAPYGTKSPEAVRSLTLEHIQHLVDQGVKAVVVACNTATSVAIRSLREAYPAIPIIGIEPAIKPAVLYKKNSNILVMATTMTLSEKKFQDLVKKYESEADFFLLPCPGLVEWVEEGKTFGSELESFIESLFAVYRKKEESTPFDAVVLGCTHYPLIRGSIQNVVGKEIPLFDGGWGTACEVKRRLEHASLLNNQTKKGSIVFENSLNSAEKIELCQKLLATSK